MVDVTEILVHWHAGRSHSEIATVRDRGGHAHPEHRRHQRPQRVFGMIIDTALEQALRTLKLSGMVHTLEARLAQARAGELGHIEFLQVLCHDEIARRESEAINRRIRRATFEQQATLEGFDFAANPKLPAAQIRDLAALRWLAAGESVVLYGPVGVGKSHVAQALGHLAIRQGADVRFLKTSRVLATLAGGHADRTWDKRLHELVSRTTARFLAHGVRYIEQSASQYISTLQPGHQLQLRPEPRNIANPNAIQITDGEVELGYVPHPLVGYVADVLGRGPYILTVVTANSAHTNPHLRRYLQPARVAHRCLTTHFVPTDEPRGPSCTPSPSDGRSGILLRFADQPPDLPDHRGSADPLDSKRSAVSAGSAHRPRDFSARLSLRKASKSNPVEMPLCSPVTIASRSASSRISRSSQGDPDNVSGPSYPQLPLVPPYR